MIRTFLFFLCFASVGHAQEVKSDSLQSEAFLRDFEAMVTELDMQDSVEVEFRRIYTEYGLIMKEAYENNVGWMALGHTYEWASRDRDSKLKVILTPDQLYLFKKRQKELERAARERKRLAETQENSEN